MWSRALHSRRRNSCTLQPVVRYKQPVAGYTQCDLLDVHPEARARPLAGEAQVGSWTEVLTFRCRAAGTPDLDEEPEHGREPSRTARPAGCVARAAGRPDARGRAPPAP